MRLLLGIDEGTTAVKATLFDERLRPLRAARRAKSSRHPRPGWVEQDAEEILAAVVEAVAEVLAGAPGEVVACGLDHQGESVLAWDATSGTPLSPVVTWQDKRSAAVLERLGDRAETIRERSGLPLDPYFSAGKLAWLLEHEPAVSAAREAGTLRLGTVDAFLCDRLGAGFATDPSTASRTQLADIRAPGAWDPELCATFGVSIGALPALRDSAAARGTLRHPSWPAELPLFAQVVDQQAALAGSGCVTRGAVKATYGTGVFVLAHAGSTPPSAPGLLPTVAWRIGGRVEYALEGGVFAAGTVLQWLCDELGIADDPAALGALAGSVDDAGGVRLLPAPSGLGAPWWLPEARAVLAGVSGATTRAHVARAALEGIAWRVADVVAAVAGAVEVSVLRADGGLTRDPLLIALQADALGFPVELRDADATVAGAAALAAVGAGVHASLEESAALLPEARRVAPAADGSGREAAHAAWRAFVRAAAELA